MVIVEIAMSMRPDEVAAKQRLEAEILDLDVAAHLLGDGAHEVDLEALELAALVLDLPRRVRRIGADLEGLGGRRRGEGGDGEGRRECAKHGSSSCVPLLGCPCATMRSAGEDVYYWLPQAPACSRLDAAASAPLSVSTRFGRGFPSWGAAPAALLALRAPPHFPRMDRVLPLPEQARIVRRRAASPGLRARAPC